MISKNSLKSARRYCNTDVSQIEGYDDAISAEENYTCHHVLEWLYRMDELIAMNLYHNVDPEFLIWMPTDLHCNNPWLHAAIKRKRKPVSDETRKKLSDKYKGVNNPMYGKRNKLVDGKRIFY